ncbi:MAG: right-handed parallel beta-helix repeat-containing protein [Desulfobacteraceae bacterium]|nr:right-handed parallel beta-helix repeat-containing protein [Desulfobacteraceae bacterium]
MHIQKIINSLKSALLISLLILGFNASNTFADFYVIAGSKGVGTKITSLPKTIASPGFYYIAQDLSCAAGSHGITIDADDVTLDLMGFSLVGPGNTAPANGIHISGRTNVEIRNGTIKNFGNFGIGGGNTNSKGHRIINIRVWGNSVSGISIDGNSHLIDKCTAGSNGTGDGIWVGSSCIVTGSTCYNNGRFGIDAQTGSHVTGNTCNDNTSSGIYAAFGTSVIGNACYNNLQYGIFLQGRNLVDQNTAWFNAIGEITYSSTSVYGNNCPIVHAP